ncbi:Cyclin-dependent kinase 8 [Nowakowskiella sp. JEL0078]|nr:Cyclin-dependent kinase 8 [Nowakowskiella sp. JEL0078]
MWATGCIFAELILLKPIFDGKEIRVDSKNPKAIPFQINQIQKIFDVLGTPTADRWSGIKDMPDYPRISKVGMFPNKLREIFTRNKTHLAITENAFNLLSKMLEYDPSKRITAEEALNHPYFKDLPLPNNHALQTKYPLRRPPKIMNTLGRFGTLKFGVRYASISSASEVYFPSVIQLIHKNNIPADVVSQIPRTGPKKRLLKGDVLAYLSNPLIFGEGESSGEDWVPVTQAFYSHRISIQKTLQFAKVLWLKGDQIIVSDILVKAVAAALVEVPELNNKKTVDTLTTYRLTSAGVSFASFNNIEEITAASVGKSLKFLPSIPLISKGTFSIIDQTASESKELLPIIAPKQTGIIVIDSIENYSAKFDSSFEFLIGKHTRSPKQTIVRSFGKLDEIDILNSRRISEISDSEVDFELVVRNKEVKGQAVDKFFSALAKKLDDPASLISKKK